MSNAWIRKDGRLIVMDNMGIFHILEDWTIIQRPEPTSSGVTKGEYNERPY